MTRPHGDNSLFVTGTEYIFLDFTNFEVRPIEGNENGYNITQGNELNKK